MLNVIKAFIIGLFMASCTEKVTVDLGSTYTRLVVDGYIANDTGNYVVNLTKTADYFYNEPVPRVTGATVKISDGTSVFPLSETAPGVYSTGSGFAGTAGKTYTLSIDLKEAISGNTHYEGSDRLEPVAKLDSIQVVFQPDWGDDGVWQVNVFAKEPGDQVNYYLFRYYRNDTLESDTITKWTISDDKYFNGSYINGLSAFYINNKTKPLNPGDRIRVQMSGITREYYDFISQVQMAGINIPFFTGPPANVSSNMDNGAVGFFAAISDSWAEAEVKAPPSR